MGTTGSQAPLDGIRRRLTSKLEVWLDRDIPKSPLQHLLKSNVTPSDYEITTIRALITDAEGRIEELHHRFPTRNRTYRAKESRLLEFIEAHKALLSPVRCIPSEILQEIFLFYADSHDHARSISRRPSSNNAIAIMPWHLGHISHRWREISLSLPSLWDNLPKFDIGQKSLTKQSYIRAFTCLMQRSGAHPTLKFHIYGRPLKKMTEYRILNLMVLHSERLHTLHIDLILTTMRALQGFKGCLPNLRILRLDLNATFSNTEHTLDIFETAPALRQVTLAGYQTNVDNINLLLPWFQITHFEERLGGSMLGPHFVPLSSLPSLTCLDIDKAPLDGFTPLLPYEPTTLLNLHTLKVVLHHSCHFFIRDFGIFFECLTIPAVEVIKIHCMAPLVPRLVSMFSRSHAPSRLQKLAFRTIPLKAGELSALLKLTPQLIELDIVVPPTYDILRLIYGQGGVMLVPMLQALYMHECMLVRGDQTVYFDSLAAQVRCQLSSKDSDDAITPSLGSRNTLDMLRIAFDSAEDRDESQKILNAWSRTLSSEEARAVDTLALWRWIIRRNCIFDFRYACVAHHRSNCDLLNKILACIEKCEAITNKVLRVGFFLAYACVNIMR